MADAGFKLSVEGEKEFRKAISDINAILKLNQTELKRSVAEYNASDKDMAALTKRHEELESAITTQIGAVAEMSGELSRLRGEYGENSTGVVKLQGAVNDAAASLATMQAELAKVEEEIERANANSNVYGMTMEEIDAQIAAFSAELKAMDAVMEGGADTMRIFSRDAEETEKRIAELREKNDLLSSSVSEHEKKLKLLNAEMQDAVKLYGSQSKEVAEYRTKIAQTTIELGGMTREIELNKDEIKKAETGALDLKDVFEKISELTGVQIPEGLTNMIGGIDNAALAAGGLVTLLGSAAKGLYDIQSEVLGENTEINKIAESAGLAASDVQELSYIAGKYHVEVDSIIDTLKDLRNNMYDAANGNEELQEKFKKLGVQISDDRGLRNVYTVYKELSDVWGRMTNEAERLAAMEEILGESVNQSAAVAAAGMDNLQLMINEAWHYGYAYSDVVNDSLREQQELLDDLSLRWEGFKNKLAVFWSEIGVEALGGDDGFGLGEALSLAGNGGTLINTIQALFKTINKFRLDSYATGTYNHPGGYAMVGENGPEIVDLPAGSRVYPNGEYPNAGTVNYYNITIPSSDIKEFNDIVRIAQSKRVTERMK